MTKDEQRIKFLLVINNLPILIAHIDSTGRYRFVNKAYAQHFSATVENIIGKYVKTVLGEELYNSTKNYRKRVLSGQIVTYEVKAPNQDGNIRDYYGRLLPYFDANKTQNGYIVLFEDITDYKRKQKEIQEAKFHALQVTVSTVMDTVNNSLNNLQLFWLKMKKSCDFNEQDTEMFKKIIFDTSEKLKAMGAMKEFKSIKLASMEVLDYEKNK